MMPCTQNRSLTRTCMLFCCCCGIGAAQVDVRQPDGQALLWSLSADVEALTWNPSQPTCFLVSSEDGLVVAFDARKGAGV
jgi:hypothetical protein